MTPAANPERPAVAGRRRPRRPSLFVQMIGVIVLSLAAAQAINLAIMYFLPPPPPEFFRISELAKALEGDGRVSRASNGRELQGVVTPAPRTSRLVRNSPVALVLRSELAARLQRPAADVRLDLLDAQRAPVRRSVRTLRRQFTPEPLDRQADHFVVAPFDAAVRRPDGRWTELRVQDTGLLSTWQQRVLLWFALSVVALAPVAYLFARGLAAPIALFAGAAERLGRDPTAPPLAMSGSPEIERAAAAFNEMQDRLRRYVEDRTGMIAAIAHDLRTPLTRLRFRVEAAPEALRPKMNADIDEMEQMIAAVMAFVRDASGTGERRPVELQALVAGVAGEMADTGLDVRVGRGSEAVVDGDALALRRLAGNLLDNAVKFGVRAQARVYAEEGAAVLEVDDEGPGVPEAEREAMFEPFRRAEPSRSRQTGGVGLGLAVVRTIARAHGGDAELENLPKGGLRARARLPLASPRSAA